ncbi:MAG: family 16 glycosylhydrolase [Pseudomonadota bacterium]
MTSVWKRILRPAHASSIGGAALLLGLAGCASDSIGDQVDGTMPVSVSQIGELGERVLVPVGADPMIAAPLHADANSGFSTYDWTVSEYTPDAGLQNVTWNKSHVALGDRYLSLMITAPQTRGQRFGSGEIQTLDTMGYGQYEAVIRPAMGSGLLSSVYSRAEGDESSGASEFGFAFQGKDTTEVFIRLMVDDVVLVQDKVALGFDAGQAFHTYGLKWTPDALIWQIDGEDVHRVDRTLAALPDRPGKLFANVWAGTDEQAHWMGRPRFASGVSLDIACVAHQPMDKKGQLCGVPSEPPLAMAVAGGTGG